MTDTTQNPDTETDIAPEREADALELGRAPSDTGAVVKETFLPHHVPDSSYQNYLFGKAGQEDRPAWSDSTHGRAAIRLVSRGIVGSAFFVIGGRMARQQMATYDEHAVNWSIKQPFHNPLQAVAKGIDMTFGAGYKKLYEVAANIGMRDPAKAKKAADAALWFRDTKDFGRVNKLGQAINGRSYGAEVVGFTFDFAAASIGDATTRNLFQVFDPNVKKSWLVNDKGEVATHGEHKHIVWSKWAKATASTTWRILSKNQGEDWFAGLTGYAFQMKFQSKFLSGAFAGKRSSDGLNRFAEHDIVFDRALNGGAYRRSWNAETKKMEIVGDAQLVGALDLHARFVGYNWYTLMFREGYDKIGHALTQWKDDGFAIHAPHIEHFNPITSTVDGLAHTGRYLAKSFIKANMYMNPAVVPFWMARVSQSKWRGEKFIDEINGKLTMGPNTNVFKTTQEWEAANNKIRAFNSTHAAADHLPLHEKLHPYAKSNYDYYPKPVTLLDKVELGFSKGMNALGGVQFEIGKKAGTYANKLADKKLLPRCKWLDDLMSYEVSGTDSFTGRKLSKDEILHKGRKNFMHEYTDAAIAYTPYMFAKAEFGLRVDDSKGDGKPGLMDKAIYRFMDNVASFNMPATWKSVKEMWQLGTHFENDVTMREGNEASVPEPTAIKTQTFSSSAPQADRKSAIATQTYAENGTQADRKTAIATQTLPETAPSTTVAAGNVTHESANFGRRAYDAKPSVDEDKSWAESVVGSTVNPAQIIPGGATRH